MGSVRKRIHLNYSSGSHELNDIFSYFHHPLQDNKKGGDEQVTLGITSKEEDRRGNTTQFDLAYVKVDEEEVLTVFDNASTTTLLLRDLIKDGKINVVHTTNTSKVKGIGGAADAEVVEIVLYTRNRKNQS